MIYVKVNEVLYPASIETITVDRTWDRRSSKIIRLTMTANEASQIFIDDVSWSIVERYEEENEQIIQNEYDNSEFCIAGDIIDHRNGEVSVKMGKLTDNEALNIIMGGTYNEQSTSNEIQRTS